MSQEDSDLSAPPPTREDARVVKALPHSVADRLALWVARAVFFLIAVGLGIHGARAFSSLIPDYDVSPYTGISVAVVALRGTAGSGFALTSTALVLVILTAACATWYELS